MTDGQLLLAGGCQCGRIRYAARASTNEAYYCHCRMCQRAVGNVFATFVNLKKRDVTWERGEPSYFASSSFSRRGFCAHCGTPLSFEYLDSENMDLTVGSLDAPSQVRPTSHFGIESRVASFHVEDGLPGRRADEAASLLKRWKDAYGDDVVPGPRST